MFVLRIRAIRVETGFRLTAFVAVGRFVKQEQWERWRAKQKVVGLQGGPIKSKLLLNK